MTGLNRYTDKEKRKMRRHNHIARDLRTPKFRQRVVQRKKTEKWCWNDVDEE